MGKIADIITKHETLTERTPPPKRETKIVRRQTNKRPSARKALDFWFAKAREHGYTDYTPEYTTKNFGQMKHWLDSQYMADKTHADICERIELVIISWNRIRAEIKDDYGKRINLDAIPTFEQYMRYKRKIDSILMGVKKASPGKAASSAKRIIFPV